ncbi:MAG: nucleotidyl transferase AbiEii/AbiGii toxin family protein [Bacteroidetes bacterium]|nr:nucleotidyl transferase AbiEii/AbiGii toxin family protein [Bacteroidota bacterium]
MTFHQSQEFADALQAAAGHFKMRPIFIEKDYWVTYVLKSLSQSKHVNEVVFKGGTSLSKAHNCIERFSEDIDLALVKESETSANQLNKKMKSIEVAVTKDLEYFQHEKEEKRGRNRRTFYNYAKVLSDADFGQVKDHIQLEINTFTNPAPHEEIKINSYVAQFLEQAGFIDRIKEHQLDPFVIKVLTRERTFFEKLLSLVRLSYEGPDKLREKIRHFYDLHKLLGQQDLTLLHPKNFEIIDLVKADDNSNEIFKGEWMNKPFSSSPLFEDVEKSWKEVESTYKKDLAELVWSELPDPKKIVSSLMSIRQFVIEYDSK